MSMLSQTLQRRGYALSSEASNLIDVLMQKLQQGEVCLELASHDAPIIAQLVEQGLSADALGFQPFTRLGNYWYLTRYAFYITQIAQHLSRLRKGSSVIDVLYASKQAEARQVLQALFPSSAGSPSAPTYQDQQMAVAGALLQKVLFVSGGPGTGKTTTVIKILAALQTLRQGQLRIALAAPTGKAAQRMSESIRLQKGQLNAPDLIRASIPEKGKTLHRLLGFVPNQIEPRYHAGKPLDVDVLVVDEASMIDVAMMSKLLAALPDSARLILLGDEYQLEAVEAGAVYGELCSLRGFTPDFIAQLKTLLPCELEPSHHTAGNQGMANGVFTLNYSYRFGVDSGIGQLARCVKAGDWACLQQLQTQALPDIQFVDGATPHMQAHLRRALMPHLDAYRQAVQAQDISASFSAFYAFKVLCAVREGISGVEHLNQVIQKQFIGGSPGLAAPLWYAGRAIMITTNDYSKQLFNGDIGIALQDEQGELKVYFEQESGQGYRCIFPANLPEHELAFAMTIHKSQGSEFDHVLMVLPDQATPILSRNLVYTGITRAKQLLIIYAPSTILREAVQKEVAKNTGLAECLV